MVFSSLLFLFTFLPITILFYFIAGKRFWNIVLLTASLFFYAWGEPIYVVLMCVSILTNYYLGALLVNSGESKKKLFFIISLIFNLGCLVFFKYFGMIINSIASIGGLTLNTSIPALPIGISFYTFQALSYVIDIYKGKIEPQKSLLLFALYISMFPQLVAGPIVNYGDIETQLSGRSITFESFYSGFKRFICGLAKKVLFANNIGILWTEVKLMPAQEISTLTAWIGILSFSLQIYFDFSGYSDMALGLGKMFGFHFKENFKYPYISLSVSEFWRRWHISLGSWFKEYVYIPLGGSKCNKPRLIRNLFIVWLLTGIWHGASWNFLVWGLYFGLLIIVEKLIFKEYMEKWPKIIRHMYLLFFVGIGWVFFEFNNMSDIFAFLRILFCMDGNYLINTQTLFVLKGYIPLFIFSIIGTTPIPRNMAINFARKHSSILWLAETVYCCVLLFFGTACIVGSTYNPFIYFRF